MGRLPLVVVTAGQSLGGNPAWGPAQRALVGLSSNSRQLVIGHANHSSLLVEPTDAMASAAAVREVVDDVRKGTPLGK